MPTKVSSCSKLPATLVTQNCTFVRLAVMDNFIVSARKYRPSTFSTVVGQQSITNTLKNAIKTNHLAQAFLFCGSRGVGKTTCARILAKTINCSNRTDQIEACNECDSCQSFNAGNSLNIYELDAASNNSVDDIRNLTDQVRFAPQIGSHKVYIIDEVHMLSKAAFNAFLKTLEEPPAHAIFILATTEKHKIIPTILSRCQIFDFHRIGVDDIASHLGNIAEKEDIAAEEEALHMIAEKADGALRDALSIFDQLVSFSGKKLSYEAVIENLNILDYDYYFRCTKYFLEQDISSCLLLFNEVLKKGFDGHLFINGLASHLRNLLVCQDEKTLSLLEVGKNVQVKYREQALNCDVSFLKQALEICRKCDIEYRNSKNQRLLVELSLMQIASIGEVVAEKKKPRIKAPEELNQNSEASPKQETGSAEPSPPKVEIKKENQESVEEETANHKKELQEPKPQAEAVQKEKETAEEPKETKSTKAEKFAKLKAQRAKTSALSINKLTKEQEEKAEQEQKEAYSSDLREPFTKEAFLATWKTLAEKIQKKNDQGNSIIYAAMTAHELKVDLESGKIHLLLDNKSQLEEMALRLADIHEYLRKKLKNGLIELSFEVIKNQKQRKAFTPEEKFNKLAEKNPALLQLKKEFDLDIF